MITHGAARPSLREVWTSGVLVAAAGSDVSGWVDVRQHDALRIARTHAGGAYALEVDWSRDGVAVDVTQALTVANNASAEVLVAAPFARLRVRNTDGVAAFTAHRTIVHAR